MVRPSKLWGQLSRARWTLLGSAKVLQMRKEDEWVERQLNDYVFSPVHKSESSRSARLVIFHHNAVNHLAIAAKVTLQAVCLSIPAQT